MMRGLWLNRLALVLCALALGLVVSGTLPSMAGGEPGLEAALAWAGHVLFAGTALLLLATSKAWRGTRTAVADSGFPSLRSLAWVAPVAVLAQVALGAAYRHKVIGAIPHVVWAFGAAIIVMMAGAFALGPAAGQVRKISIAMISAAGLQVVLGVAALLARMSETAPGPLMKAATLLHLGTGSMVLGLTAAWSAWILRDAEPAGAQNKELASPGRHS
jgi:hypothetical protein